MSQQSNTGNTNKKPSLERNMLATAKGGSFLAFGSLFAYASRFVIALVLARLLGVEQFGMYSLAISSATIISNLSTLGLDSTMVRYIAIQARRKDEASIWGTIQIGMGFSFLVSLLLSAGLFVLSEPIAVQIFHERELASFLELFSLFIPFSTASLVLVDIARGFKRMDYSALGDNVILFITRFCLIGILALVNLNAYTAIIAYGLSDVVVTFSLIYLVNKEFTFKRPLRQSQRNYREIFVFAAPFWFSALLRKIRGNLQTLLLGSLNTVTSVGIFTVVNKTTLVGHLVYSSILGSVKPILAELQDQNNWEQMGQLYKTTTRWAFLANLPLFLIMLLYPEALLAIFGRSFSAGALALTIFAFGELVNSATGICGSIIDMTGRTKLKFINSIISTTLVLAGNILLIPRWGVVGTAVASFAAVSVLNILRVVQVWYLYRLHPYNRTFLKPILAGMVAAGAALLMEQWLSIRVNIWYTVFHVFALLVSYGGTLLLLGLAPEEKTILMRLHRRMVSVFTSLHEAILNRLPAKLRTRKI